MSTISQNVLDRFMSKIKKQDNGCWEWQAAKHRQGYGMFTANGKFGTAHRFSAKYLAGLNTDNLHVCHKCDNPCCVNPDHLFVGTHQDNMRDMHSKGRAARKTLSFEHASSRGKLATLRVSCIHCQKSTTANNLSRHIKNCKG